MAIGHEAHTRCSETRPNVLGYALAKRYFPPRKVAAGDMSNVLARGRDQFKRAQMQAPEPLLNAPIFIVGAPRSGTTLLRNMLNRHPVIAIGPETDFNHYVYSRRQSFGSLSESQNRQRLVDAYLATEHVRKMRVDLKALRDTLLREGTSYENFFASLLRFYAQSQGKKRWGEKTPRHAFMTETLCDWYVSGTVIHLVRDPRDVVASSLHLPGATNNVLGGAYLWLHCNLEARKAHDRPQYLLIRYEELVKQPEQELRRICAVLGVEYSPVMLLPNCDPASVLPWYRRAEEPVTTDRLGKWRDELTPDHVALVEWIVGPHMPSFGYEVVGRAPTNLAIFRGATFAAFDAVKRRITEFPAAWYYFTRSTNLVKEENARHRFRKRFVTSVN